MIDLPSVRWLGLAGVRVCVVHPVVAGMCVVGFFGYLIFYDAHQSAARQQAFDHEVKRHELSEMAKDAELRRQKELYEMFKPPRDLTKPAKPDEGF